MTDWQTIVDKYGRLVWHTAYRLLNNEADASDCFQETFLSALEVVKKEPVRDFKALLSRIATARAIDILRHRITQEKRFVGEDGTAEMPDRREIEPDKALEQKDLADRVRQLLVKLPPQEAEVFCLRHFEDMSLRQIAGQLGISTVHAGVILHRGKEKLRALIDLPQEMKGGQNNE